MTRRDRLLQLMKNTYFLLGAGFLIWITCFDAEDLITQYQLWRKVQKLEQEKKYYVQQIAIVQKEREELASNNELLEKFAREKYYMRKPTEDLYIVID